MIGFIAKKAADDNSVYDICEKDIPTVNELLEKFLAVLENENNQSFQMTNSEERGEIGNNLSRIGNYDKFRNRLSVLKPLFKFRNITFIVRSVKGVIDLFLLPILVSHFREAGTDSKKIARIFTVGGPIFQEFGSNVLSFLCFTNLILGVFLGSFRYSLWSTRLFFAFHVWWGLGISIASYYYASKLVDPIEKFFLISIMTVRTYGGFPLPCGIGPYCLIDLGYLFSAGIGFWYTIQNLKWSIAGVNVLDASVKLWNPF